MEIRIVIDQHARRLRPGGWAMLAMLAVLAGWGLAVRAQQNPPPAPPPAPPPSPLIARIEGRPITQQDFDRVGQPDFERLKAEMKKGFTPEVQKLANKNVIDELLRRELLVIEAQRRKIPVTEAETDKFLSQDPFFLTNGKFDPQKLIQYKINPGTNYITVLPKVRELVAASRLDSLVRAQLTPSPAAVRAEWAKRNDQVRFKFLSLSSRDISLEPEATEAEQAAYYGTHADQFERKARARLRYLRLAIPPEGDSTRTAVQDSTMRRAGRLADSLSAGASIDTLAAGVAGGALDTGLFDLPPAAIPGIPNAPEILGALAHADSDTSVRVVGPAVAGEAIVVGVVAERHPHGVPPMREVLADVKRRADIEKRRAVADSATQKIYQAYRQDYRSPKARVTRVLLPEEKMSVKPPLPNEVATWYAAHGRALLAVPDTLALPALNDSLRQVVRLRLEGEARTAKAAETLQRVAASWRAGREVARAAGVAVETREFVKGVDSDSIFPPPVFDSLFADPATPKPGPIQGPRSCGGRAALWRVDAVDTAYVPPFETV